MKTFKKYLAALGFLGLFLTFSTLQAQDVTTIEAKDSDISDNLDLEAVASIFGEAKDLEDFENKLNDPELQISNLDLNENGEVDYLRVVELAKDDTHVITIQAVLGEDLFQDVATIDVEKDSNGETHVQVVGDVYMYGTNYIVEPVYVQPPPISIWFWGAFYRPWHSPFYWGHYPPHYRPWRPCPAPRYRSRVHVHVNTRHAYHRTNVRRSRTSANIHSQNRRNDYGRQHPNKSFDRRNTGVQNRAGLPSQKATANRTQNRAVPQSTGRQVQNNWKPQSERNGNRSSVNNNKVTVPSQNRSTRPAASPSQNVKRSQNTQRPQTVQRSQNVQRSSARPAARPQTAPRSAPSSARRR